ncbi:MAG: PASTA domain-containing protein [Saprospiraceae bacterium]|nr:PASTA domain-containing protein [Saprospiraceae bacterium]
MTVKQFFIQLALMALVVILLLGGVMIWLRFYTNHGQKLELPDYKEMHIKDAKSDAELKTFEVVVKDSAYRVGMPGGLILTQNPKPGSLVKEGRKIYVDISKYNPDLVALSDLRPMYGHEYSNKQRELASLFINSKIKSRRYDPGEPDHILEVWYEGDLIEGKEGVKKGVDIKVGGTLEFVVSGLEGGKAESVDYTCKTLREMQFILDYSRLKMGKITRTGVITNMEDAYIIAQNPPHEEGKTIPHGTKIDFTVQQDKPESCL